jgi:hypothetical protein
MYPEFSAISDGSGTRVHARLKVGGKDSNTFVDVKGEDSLVATVGTEEKTLEEVGSEEFAADFKADEGGTKVNIALDRGEADDGAPASKATLPEAFDLTLESAKIIRRGDPIMFSWAPAGGPGTMKWDLDSDCTFIASGVAGDDGTFTIKGEDHNQIDPEDDDEKECTATLTLDRVLKFTVDKAFDGGEFVAIQRRTVRFTSVGPDAELKDEPKPSDKDAGVVPDAGGNADAGGEPADEPKPDAAAAEPDAGAEPATDAGK